MSKSNLEEKLLNQIKLKGLPEPEREFMFAKPIGRKFRADFAYPEKKLLIECEGGVWIRGGGRHNRGIGFEKDMEKYNIAAMLGYFVLRFGAKEINSWDAVRIIEEFLK